MGTNDIAITQGVSGGVTWAGTTVIGCDQGGSWGWKGFEEKHGCTPKKDKGFFPEQEISVKGFRLGISALCEIQLSLTPAEYARCMTG